MTPTSTRLAELATILGLMIAVLGGIIGAVSYLDRLDNRITQLEQQVNKPNGAPAGPSIGGSPPQPVPNPVAETCADLARRAADEMGRGSMLVAEQLERMMSNLHCTQSIKN